MLAEYAITPIVIARGIQREMSRFTYLNNYGVKFDIPYVIFLIQGGDLTVLVDAACSAQDYQRWIKPPGAALQIGGESFRDVEDVTPIEDALGQRGLAFGDIDILVQTHLDWDHCMNTLKFQGPRVVVQRSELEDQPVHPLYANAHAPGEIYERYRKLNLDVVEGDHNLADGLDLLYTPGHTVGGQSVVVRTSQGPWIIAGLCTTNDNYFLSDDQKQQLGVEVIPPGTLINAIEAYDSVLKIREIGGTQIMPLHEPSLEHLGTIA